MLRLARWIAFATVAAGIACDDPPPRHSVSESAARVERAAERFAASRTRLPKSSDPQLAAALQAIVDDRDDEALRLLDQILVERPHDAHAKFLRGFARHRRKLYVLARPDFEAVLEAGPVFHRADAAFLYYAWSSFYLGDLDTAEAAFEAVIRLDVDPADGNYGIGLIAFDRGDLAAAEARMKRAKELALKEIAAAGSEATASHRTNLGKAEVQIGKILLARCDLDPDPRAVEQRLAEALKELEHAISLVAWSDEAWFTLARVHARLGNAEKERIALAKYNEVKDKPR